MPAHIILVHDDPRFIKDLVEGLRSVGHNVVIFGDPLAALGPIDALPHIDVLITRVRFPAGRGNGAALAQGTRLKRPGLKVLFTVAPENVDHVEGLGEFVVAPVCVPELIAMVNKLVAENGPSATG